MSSSFPAVFTQEIDTLQGGADADTFALQNNSNQIQILLVNPPETETGTNQNDDLFGTDNNDGLYGRRGDDTISGLMGDDFLDGETGDDLLFGGQGDDSLVAEVGNDTVFGDIGFDQLYGGVDADVLFGNADNDTLYGDSGQDVLYGGKGNDRLTGGTESDSIFGDNGEDTLTGVSHPDLGYTHISDFDPGEDTILLPGNRELYQLILTATLEDPPIEIPDGTAILAVNEADSPQLMAVVEGVTSLNLNQSYFEFI